MAKKSRKLKLILITTLLFIVILYNKTINYRSHAPQTVFHIEKGATVNEIANNLKAANLINSTTIFKLYARLQNLDQKIIAGNFPLSGEMNNSQILENLTVQSLPELSFTILEGHNIKKIDENLAKAGLIQAGEFITATEKSPTPLEGYLYPDTYFLSNAFTPQELIDKATENFRNKTANLTYNRPIKDILTMASIIEAEVFGEEDRAIVSGIFWKRLENNWPIGADATLLYITNDRTITKTDLSIDSPYNTRKNLGLPPTPIGNPSLSSINAALNPKESPYWFYLTTLDTGKVIYAKTNEEHNINREKYL